MELVASTEAPWENEAGQSILKQTEPSVLAWLQNLLSPMAAGAGSTCGSCWCYRVLGSAVRVAVGAGWWVMRGWVYRSTARALWWLGAQDGCGGEQHGMDALGVDVLRGGCVRGGSVTGWMFYGMASRTGWVLRPSGGCAGCGYGVGGGFGCRVVGVGVWWCLWWMGVWDECVSGSMGAGWSVAVPGSGMGS